MLLWRHSLQTLAGRFHCPHGSGDARVRPPTHFRTEKAITMDALFRLRINPHLRRLARSHPRSRVRGHSRSLLIGLLALLVISVPVVVIQAVSGQPQQAWVEAGATYWAGSPS